MHDGVGAPRQNLGTCRQKSFSSKAYCFKSQSAPGDAAHTGYPFQHSGVVGSNVIQWLQRHPEAGSSFLHPEAGSSCPSQGGLIPTSSRGGPIICHPEAGSSNVIPRRAHPILGPHRFRRKKSKKSFWPRTNARHPTVKARFWPWLSGKSL